MEWGGGFCPPPLATPLPLFQGSRVRCAKVGGTLGVQTLDWILDWAGKKAQRWEIFRKTSFPPHLEKHQSVFSHYGYINRYPPFIMSPFLNMWISCCLSILPSNSSQFCSWASKIPSSMKRGLEGDRRSTQWLKVCVWIYSNLEVIFCDFSPSMFPTKVL